MTLRQMLGFFGFSRTVEHAHDLESFLISNIDSTSLNQSEEFEIKCIELKKRFKDNMDFITNNISQEWIKNFDALSVSTQNIVEIEEVLKTKYPDDKELLKMLQSLYFIRAAEVFNRFAPMARDLMAKIGKKIKPLSIKGGQTLVPKETFFPLANVLTHIIRNMVHHGIESPDERIASNKDENGEIGIEIGSHDQNGAKQGDGYYSILLTDDGRGIDFEKVKKVAQKKKLLNGHPPNEEELTRLLFSTRISTASKVDEISGRGAGLMSVSKVVKSTGGKDFS